MISNSSLASLNTVPSHEFCGKTRSCDTILPNNFSGRTQNLELSYYHFIRLSEYKLTTNSGSLSSPS